MKGRLVLSLFTLLLTLAGCYPNRIYVPPLITDEMKKDVAFLYVDFVNPNAKRIEQKAGTGFFIGLLKHGTKEYLLYYVTCRHVFEPPKDCVPLNLMKWHIHDAEGDLFTPPMPLITEGENKNIYFHKDPDVDIAIISLVPDPKIWNYGFEPEHLIMNKEEFLKDKIFVGTDVFFLGWSIIPMGKRQNHPIARFGKITQLDKDAFEENKSLLIESTAFGGNSGSPVFAYFGGKRVKGTLRTYEPEYKLIGILKGYLPERLKMKGMNQDAFGVKAYENSGISIVVPSYLLLEMLYSEEFVKERSERPKEMIIEYRVPKR